MHVVPRFYLKRWERPESRNLYCLDKETSNITSQSANATLKRNNFYTIKVERELYRKYERLASKLIGSICESSEVVSLSEDQVSFLAEWLRVQIQRGPSERERIERITRMLVEERNVDPTTPALDTSMTQSRILDDDHVYPNGLKLTRDNPLNRLPVKLVTIQCKELNFYTSDHPVVIDNWYHRLGRLTCPNDPTTPGYLVFYPVSPKSCLVWLENTIEPLIPSSLKLSSKKHVHSDIVEWVNELQVIHAKHHVISQDGDFSTARRLLEAYPVLRGNVQVSLTPSEIAEVLEIFDQAKKVYRSRGG